MNATDLQAQIAAATAYEELFVKGLLHEWTPRVMVVGKVLSGHRVLDVACGTGVLAREAALRVGPIGSVVGLDTNPGMLAVAERLTPQLSGGREWQNRCPFRTSPLMLS